MNNQNTLLVGLLVMAAVIVLFETGTLMLDQNTFQAQAGMADMVLNNNGEGAIIEVGSHIMVTNKFESEITLEFKSRSIDAKSILSVMTMGATQGCQIKLSVEGRDEEFTFQTIEDLFNNRFGESE